MSKTKLIVLGLVFCLLVVSNLGLAKKKNIYVGDIIKLKLKAADLTPEEIRQKFKQFEIVNLEEQPTGYRLAIRSFKPGEKTVKLKNRTLKITIKSTLQEFDRKQIYSSELAPKAAGFSVPYRYLLWGLLILVIGGLGLLVWKFIKRRNRGNLTPYQQFQQQVEAASVAEENYLVELTLAVKRYLDQRFDCQIAGKTAAEMAEEMSNLESASQYQTELEDWFQQTAVYKYRPEKADQEVKQQLKQEVVDLVTSIHNESENNETEV